MFKRFIIDMDKDIEEYRKFLWKKPVKELVEMCKERGIKRYSGKLKKRIIDMLVSYKLDEKTRTREKFNKLFDFDELMGIRDLLPKE